MIPVEWSIQNALSLSIGLILSFWALSRLLIIAIIKVSIAFKTIQSNKESLVNHVQDTDEKFKDLNVKVSQISEKIDKIYTILINK